MIIQGYAVEIGPHEILCREGEFSSDLFFLKSGSLLACVLHGTQVKALAKINPGEFFGELSFFDGKPRASYVVSLEKCELIKIPKDEIQGFLPTWFLQIGTSLTKKIRLLDEIVHEAHLKRFGTQEIKPLTIEEQRQIYKSITYQKN